MPESIPRDFNSRGFDVLNIDRVGYGGNPIPLSTTPLYNSAPIYADLIQQAYEQHGSEGGIVIFGHSLGGVTALIIAATQQLPLLGVSALGSIPAHLAPKSSILRDLVAFQGDRLPINTQPTEEESRRFLGTPDLFDENKLQHVFGVLEGGT